jgi:peroxiredoxin
LTKELIMHDVMSLPDDLPVPIDDGAADHLRGLALPWVNLKATDGSEVDLASLPGLSVVYAYPRTGAPGETPGDDWNLIPGARGCTPQSCSFRDHHAEIQAFGARVFGLSTQSTAYQQEAVERLHLPFPLLSDEELRFATALNLPAFEYRGMKLIKRMTLFIEDGWIEDLIYPVFPPDQNATQVLAWLAEHAQDGAGS